MHRRAWALVVAGMLMAGCFTSPPRKKEGAAPLRKGEDVAMTATRAMRARGDVKLVKYATSEDPENAPKAPVLSVPAPTPKPVTPAVTPPAPSSQDPPPAQTPAPAKPAATRTSEATPAPETTAPSKPDDAP